MNKRKMFAGVFGVVMMFAFGFVTKVNCKYTEDPKEKAFKEAAGRDDVEAMEKLYAQGAHVNAADEAYYTPLHWAAYNGSEKATQWLLVHGAKVNKRDYYNYTPLMLAVLMDHWQLISILCEAGANVGARENFGNTSLHGAAQDFCFKCCELLLRYGADPETTNNGGNSATGFVSESEEKGHISRTLPIYLKH